MRNILDSYSVAELKKMISKHNIRGYSKMKKPGILDLMTSKEHKDKFKNIKPKFSKVVKEIDRKGKKYREARDDFGKKDPKITGKKLVKPKKIPKTKLPKGSNYHSGQVESRGISKEKARNIDPLQLFKLLPTELKEKIGKDSKSARREALLRRASESYARAVVKGEEGSVKLKKLTKDYNEYKIRLGPYKKKFLDLVKKGAEDPNRPGPYDVEDQVFIDSWKRQVLRHIEFAQGKKKIPKNQEQGLLDWYEDYQKNFTKRGHRKEVKEEDYF